MERNLSVSDQDKKAVKGAFRPTGTVQTIKKDAQGHVIKDEFSGRTVKNQVSAIPKGGEQVIVAHAGQKYDDIPQKLRDLYVWTESDFT